MAAAVVKELREAVKDPRTLHPKYLEALVNQMERDFQENEVRGKQKAWNSDWERYLRIRIILRLIVLPYDDR